MNSLDRTNGQQVSQGIQIRDSQGAQQIQNQVKRRPQTSGTNAQLYTADQPQPGLINDQGV